MALLNVIPYETALRRLVHSGICSDEQLCDYTLSQSLRSVAYAVNRASTPIASLSKHCVSSANGIEEDQCASSLRVAGGVSVLCHMCTYSITSHQCQQASIYLSTRLLCDDASAYGEGNERPCCRVAWTDALCSGGTMSYLQRRMEVDRRLALGYLFILAGTMRTVGLGVVNGQRLSSHHADFVQRVLNDVVPRVAVMADTHEGLSKAHCVPPANESKDDSANTMPVAQRSSVFTRPSRLAVEANNAIIHIFHYISGDILSVHHSGEKQSSGCHLVLDRDMPNRLWPAVSVLRSALIRALNWVVQEVVAHIHSAHIANEHREAQATVEVMEGVKSALDAALSRIVKQQEALECSRKRIEQQVGISARDYHATTDMMWANTLRLCIFCKNITGAWIEVQGGIGHTEVLLSDKKVLAFIASLVASVRALEEAETDSQIFYANTALLSAALAAASAAPAPFMQSSLWLADASLTQQMHNAIVHRALRYKDENVQKLGALISQMVLYGSSLSSSTGIVTQSSEQLLELISDGRDAASQCVIRMLSRAVLERPHSLLRSMFHLLQHGDTKTRRNVLDVLSALPQMENDTVYGETISAEQMRPMLHLLAEELLLQIQDEELLVRLEGAKLFAKVWPEDVCRPLLIIALQRDKSFKKQSAARHALQLLLSAHTGSSRVVLLILEESLALLSGVIRTACLTPSTPASILAFSKFHACGSEEDAGDTVKVDVSPRAADPDATSNNNTFSARVIRLALSLFKWWAERVPIWTEACIEPIVRRVLRATTAIEQEFIIRMMAQMSTLCGATVDGASVLVRSCVNLMLCKNDEAQHAALWIEQGPISNPPRSEDGTVMPVVMSGEVKDADCWMYQVLAPLLCLRSCPRRSFACRGVEDMPRAMLDLWDLLWRLLFIPKYRNVLTTDGQRLVLELVCKYSASMILERLSCLEKELMENNRSDALGDSAAWDIRFLCRIGFFCVGSLFSQMRGVFCKNAEKVPPSGGSDEAISESFSVDTNYSETELRELLFGVPMVRRWIENTVIPWLLSDNDDSERTPSSFATEMQRLSQSAVDCAALLTLVALNCMEVDTLAISSFMQPLEELAVFYRVQLKHVKKHSAEDESACLSMNYKDLLGKFEFAIHVQKAALNIVRSHPMGRDLICLWFVKYMPQLIELANAACAVSDALKKSDVGLVAVECCHLLFLAVMASGNDKAVVQLQQLPHGTEAGFSSCVLMGLDSGDRSALLSFAVGSARYSCLPHIQSEGVKLLSALLGAAPEMFTDEYTSQSETLQEALAVLNSVALMHTDAKTRSLAVSVLEFIQKDCHDSTPGFVVPAGVGSVKDEGDVPSGCLWFRCLNCELRDSSEVESQAVFLRHYLAVDVDLEKMWEQWTAENPMCGHPLVRYLTLHSSLKLPVKIRHLRQELHETLFAFLCSQNNNVQRITSLIERLSLKYGDHLCDYNLETGDVRCFDHVCKLHRKRAARCGQEAAEERNQWIALHVLPTVEQLSAATEDELRSLGFGYRSKYIIGCTNVIRQSGVVGREVLSEHCRGATKFSESTVVPSYRWYEELLSPNCTLEERRAKLLTLPGVGRKVADCVLLFGLGHHELVPVDTHMAQVAAEYLASSGGAGSYGRREGGRLKGGKRARVNDSRSRLRGVNDIEENQRGDSTWEAVVAGWRMGNGEGKNKLPPLLPKHHDAIQVGFRSLFGEYCGWAHSILFYARMRTGAAAMNRLAEGAVSV